MTYLPLKDKGGNGGKVNPTDIQDKLFFLSGGAATPPPEGKKSLKTINI